MFDLACAPVRVRAGGSSTNSFPCMQAAGPAYTRSEAGGGQVARQSGQAGNRAALTSFSLGRSPVSTLIPDQFRRRQHGGFPHQRMLRQV